MLSWRYKLKFDRRSKQRPVIMDMFSMIMRRDSKNAVNGNHRSKLRQKVLVNTHSQLQMTPPVRPSRNKSRCSCIGQPAAGVLPDEGTPRRRASLAGGQRASRPHSAPSEVIEARLRAQRQELWTRRRAMPQPSQSLVELIDGDDPYRNGQPRRGSEKEIDKAALRSLSLPRIKTSSMNTFPVCSCTCKSNLSLDSLSDELMCYSGKMIKCARIVRRASSNLKKKKRVRLNSDVPPSHRQRRLYLDQYRHLSFLGARPLNAYRQSKFAIKNEHRNDIIGNSSLRRKMQYTCTSNTAIANQCWQSDEAPHMCNKKYHTLPLGLVGPVYNSDDSLSDPAHLPAAAVDENSSATRLQTKEEDDNGGHDTDEGIYTHDETESVDSSKEIVNETNNDISEHNSEEQRKEFDLASANEVREAVKVRKSPSFKSQVSIGQDLNDGQSGITISPANIFVSFEASLNCSTLHINTKASTNCCRPTFDTNIDSYLDQELDSLEEDNRFTHSLHNKITDISSANETLESDQNVFKILLNDDTCIVPTPDIISLSSSHSVKEHQFVTSNSVYVNKIVPSYNENYVPLETLIEESGEYVSSTNSEESHAYVTKSANKVRRKISNIFAREQETSVDTESSLENVSLEVQSKSIDFSDFESLTPDHLSLETSQINLEIRVKNIPSDTCIPCLEPLKSDHFECVCVDPLTGNCNVFHGPTAATDGGVCDLASVLDNIAKARTRFFQAALGVHDSAENCPTGTSPLEIPIKNYLVNHPCRGVITGDNCDALLAGTLSHDDIVTDIVDEKLSTAPQHATRVLHESRGDSRFEKNEDVCTLDRVSTLDNSGNGALATVDPLLNHGSANKLVVQHSVVANNIDAYDSVIENISECNGVSHNSAGGFVIPRGAGGSATACGAGGSATGCSCFAVTPGVIDCCASCLDALPAYFPHCDKKQVCRNSRRTAVNTHTSSSTLSRLESKILSPIIWLQKYPGQLHSAQSSAFLILTKYLIYIFIIRSAMNKLSVDDNLCNQLVSLVAQFIIEFVPTFLRERVLLQMLSDSSALYL